LRARRYELNLSAAATPRCRAVNLQTRGYLPRLGRGRYLAVSCRRQQELNPTPRGRAQPAGL